MMIKMWMVRLDVKMMSRVSGEIEIRIESEIKSRLNYFFFFQVQEVVL